MQTTTPATTATTQADATKTITALRKRLARWEIDHLRAHCVELAERLEAAQERIDSLEADNDRAWRTAESWREDAIQLVNDLQDAGQQIGLTQSGALVVMPAAPTTILPAIGTHLHNQGGTLGAIIARTDGSTYGLIVADAEHETTGEWGEYGQDVPEAGNTDGLAATEAMAAAGSATANAVRALSIGGHTDWYIPTRLELLSLYIHAPKGLFSEDSYYWSSTQCSRNNAFCQDFEYGSSLANDKDNEFRARPVRSIQLQPSNTSTLSSQDIAEGDPREILESAQHAAEGAAT